MEFHDIFCMIVIRYMLETLTCMMYKLTVDSYSIRFGKYFTVLEVLVKDISYEQLTVNVHML